MYCLQDVVPDILTSVVHARSADMFWGEAPALPADWLSQHDDDESVPPSPPSPPSSPTHDPVSPTPSFLNNEQLSPSYGPQCRGRSPHMQDQSANDSHRGALSHMPSPHSPHPSPPHSRLPSRRLRGPWNGPETLWDAVLEAELWTCMKGREITGVELKNKCKVCEQVGHFFV